MADEKPNNKNKAKADESILDETPPNINEPQTPPEEDITPDPEPQPAPEDPTPDPEPTPEPEPEPDPTPEGETPPETPPATPEETDAQKEQRYKAQQSEAQIQAAKNKALVDKVDEANNIPEPTEEDLRTFVAQDGADWDELTPFEQSQARRTYKTEKSLALIRQATEASKKIDEWASQVDAFIDKTDADPKYLKLSGHEADFRKFCMAEAHRGADIETMLLPAFLYNLPAPEKKRDSLFPTGGGGEKDTDQGKITDTEVAANLRATNPREYKRLLKAGKIKVEI